MDKYSKELHTGASIQEGELGNGYANQHMITMKAKLRESTKSYRKHKTQWFGSEWRGRDDKTDVLFLVEWLGKACLRRQCLELSGDKEK